MSKNDLLQCDNCESGLNEYDQHLQPDGYEIWCIKCCGCESDKQ